MRVSARAGQSTFLQLWMLREGTPFNPDAGTPMAKMQMTSQQGSVRHSSSQGGGQYMTMSRYNRTGDAQLDGAIGEFAAELDRLMPRQPLSTTGDSPLDIWKNFLGALAKGIKR